MRLWKYIKSLNETFWLACFAIVVSLIFASFFYQPKIDSSIFPEMEKENNIVDVSAREAVYYGVPSMIHQSRRYYKFNRYDLKNERLLDSNLPNSSFWVQTDYADIGRMENGKRVVSNK